MVFFFFFQAEDGIRDADVTGVQTCALPILGKESQAGRLTADHVPAWDDLPGATEIGVLRGFAGALGEALGVAAAGGRRLYGFAEHSVNSLFLGSSSGLRLRHDQPSGKVELNAKSA